MPGDRDAEQQLKEVDAAITREAYDKHMSAGREYMDKNDFLAARKEFQAALGIIKGGRKAMQKLDAIKKALYDKHMKAGRAALEKRDYDAAEKEFRGALDEIKNDRDANQLLTLARKRGKK
jgi:hypothetical protein